VAGVADTSGQAKRRGSMLAWAALVVVYVVWGSTYLAIRVGVRDFPPAMLAGVRYVIAGGILYPVAARTGDRGLQAQDRPGARQWASCAVIGLLLLAVGNGGVTVAEKSIDSGLAAVLVATVPLWIILFAVPLQRQRVSRPAAAGLATGLIGVAVLVGGGSARGHLSGVVIVLVAAAAWGLGSVLSRRLSLPRRALLGASMEMLTGGVILLIVALFSGELGQTHWGNVSLSAWLALAWLVIPGSIIAFTAYGYALAQLPLSTVSTYAYVNPVVAVVLGVLLLSEKLTLREALGALLVVASVAVTLYQPGRSDRSDGSGRSGGSGGSGGSGRSASAPAPRSDAS
jgi:drug/metabolite transporter (DMT)-like permease